MDSKYVIIGIEFLFEVQHNQNGIKCSPSSLRRSIDGSKFIFEYRNEQPSWIFQIVTKDMIGLKEYSLDEMSFILNSSEW
jgi:hypothetical protein